MALLLEMCRHHLIMMHTVLVFLVTSYHPLLPSQQTGHCQSAAFGHSSVSRPVFYSVLEQTWNFKTVNILFSHAFDVHDLFIFNQFLDTKHEHNFLLTQILTNFFLERIFPVKKQRATFWSYVRQTSSRLLTQQGKQLFVMNGWSKPSGSQHLWFFKLWLAIQILKYFSWKALSS